MIVAMAERLPDYDYKAFGARLREVRREAGISQDRLGELVTDDTPISRSAVSQWERGRTAPGYFRMKKLVQIFNVNESWLIGGHGVKRDNTPPGAEAPSAADPEIDGILVENSPFRSKEDMIPLMVVGRGGQDQEMFQEDMVGYISRPQILKGIENAYAVEVTGTSMIPKYHPGNLLHINPHYQPRPGKGVVIWKHNKAVLIKEFVRQTPDHVYVREYKPDERDFAIRKSEIAKMHTVVGLDDP